MAHHLLPLSDMADIVTGKNTAKLPLLPRRVRKCLAMMLFLQMALLAFSSPSPAKKIASAPEQATILWQGFHHKWKSNPHRLSKLGSYFNDIEFEPSDGSGAIFAEHTAYFRVGAYNDTALIKTKGQFVKSSQLGIYHASVGSDCLSVTADVGQKDSASCEQAINLKAIDFQDYDEVTVVLRGFRIWSESYSMGYNTRGFAIRLVPLDRDRDRDTFTFRAKFSIHPAHSPDRPLLGDGCSGGSHCDSYTYHAKIFYTLVGTKRGSGHITVQNDPANEYSQHIVMSPSHVPDYVSVNTRQTSISGDSGFSEGIVAIQGFSWFLDDWKKTRKDGRYIRDLRFDLADIDYNPSSGKAKFKTNMYFNNTSAWPYGYHVNFKMWNTLIQFNDENCALTDPVIFDGEINRGDFKFEEEIFYRF